MSAAQWRRIADLSAVWSFITTIGAATDSVTTAQRLPIWVAILRRVALGEGGARLQSSGRAALRLVRFWGDGLRGGETKQAPADNCRGLRWLVVVMGRLLFSVPQCASVSNKPEMSHQRFRAVGGASGGNFDSVARCERFAGSWGKVEYARHAQWKHHSANCVLSDDVSSDAFGFGIVCHGFEFLSHVN